MIFRQAWLRTAMFLFLSLLLEDFYAWLEAGKVLPFLRCCRYSKDLLKFTAFSINIIGFLLVSP